MQENLQNNNFANQGYGDHKNAKPKSKKWVKGLQNDKYLQNQNYKNKYGQQNDFDYEKFSNLHKDNKPKSQFPNNQSIDQLLGRVDNLMHLMNYSPRTIDAYSKCIKNYLLFAGTGQNLDIEKIHAFLTKLRTENKAPKTIYLHYNAIKFLFREIYKEYRPINLRIAKNPRRLPVVFSHEEIEKIIASLQNRKHKLLISLAYGAGLRVSEVVKIKVKDLYFDEGVLVIREGKGVKDRVSIIPSKISFELKKYITLKDPHDFLFESERGGRLHERTAQKIFEKALLDSGCKKVATFHSLRHSFATHLLENGVSLLHIKDLLGHKDLKTTQIYAKVTTRSLASIKSPL